MAIITTFVLNIVKNVITNSIKEKLTAMLKSKYFYICLAVFIAVVLIVWLIAVYRNKSITIKELQETLYTTELKLSNMVIEKNLVFMSNKEYIYKIFTNSTEAIEKLAEDRLFSSNEISALNRIIRDYNTARK